MPEFSYTNVAGKIPSFFEKIGQVGQPQKVDSKWLTGIGFGQANDRTLIGVLKQIGFIDGSGSPTEFWTRYRNKSLSKKVIAQALVKGYKSLFDVYPDAYKRTKDDLTNFFSTQTTAGSMAIGYTVNTFKNLADLGDFSNMEEVHDTGTLHTQPQTQHLNPEKITRQFNSTHGVTINLNIQLTVPETTDEKVYDKFFEAMKKHLLS